MSNVPSTTGSNGRGAGGRFVAGNRFARGNPHARRVALLRATLLKTVTPKDLRDVVMAVLKEAKEGDIAAAKELFLRLLGPPEELDLIERLDALEARLGAAQSQEGQ